MSYLSKLKEHLLKTNKFEECPNVKYVRVNAATLHLYKCTLKLAHLEPCECNLLVGTKEIVIFPINFK